MSNWTKSFTSDDPIPSDATGILQANLGVVSTVTIGSGISFTGGVLSATGSGGTVTSVTGTIDRISVINNTTTPVVDIAATYVGQTSITTLGTISTGTWNATPINLSSYASGTLQAAQFPSLTGDITTSAGSLATTLATVNSNVGSFGSATQVSTFTVNAKGLITAASNVTISGVAPGGAAGGDLTGTYPNPTIGANKVTNAALRQSVGLSVIGNATNSTANVADITAASDFQVLRRSGTALAFGSINLASTNAVTGVLGLANGGTNADLSATGGTSRVLRQSSTGAAITVSQLAASDLSNGTTGSGAVVLATGATLSLPVIDNPKLGYNTTVTSGGTLTLTSASTFQQFFTGSTNHTLVLPVVSTLALGLQYDVTNDSFGAIAVQSSGGNLILSVIAFTKATFTVILNTGTTAASWGSEFTGFLNVTGIGAAVLATNAVLTTPNIGTPSAGTLTNCTGLPLTSGVTGLLPLANGGLNANLTASNGGIFYSTASAGAILAGTATANKMLLSGATAAPSWSTSTIPTSAGATANKVLLSDGTNYVLSTPTFPNASATAGKVIISDGTNWIASTSLFPNTVGTAGKIIRSDGTTNAYTTSTFADTYTASNLLYSNGANTVTGLATANSSILVTSVIGVPSLATDIPTAVTIGTAYIYRVGGTDISLADGGTNASLTASNGGIFYSTASAGAILSGTATARQMLQSGTSAAPAWSTATWPATTTANQILYSSATNTVGGLATANSSVLVTDGSGVPSLATDIPTAVTIGTAYIYRVGGTDISLADGGTNASLTASNGGIFYSTASAGAILSGTATANKMLLSGASTTPSWSTSTIPSSAGATANKVLLSDGTNYVLSTPTFPNASATAGKIIRSDGTNWAASTSTFADTYAVSTILYASSANTVAGLATANSSILVTSVTGVPSLATDIPTAVTIGGAYIYRVGGTDVSVADGGTGLSSATAYAVICGGTTSTGNFQSIASVGTSGQVLTSNGAGALPTFQTVPGISGQALTKTDDTNVTLTLGGSPTTALVNAASITVGWTGFLGLARGGVNADLSATGGTSQVLRQSSTGAAITVSQLAASDLSNGTTGSGAVVLATGATLSLPIIDNLKLGFTSTVTAAGTTTLTSASTYQQHFTGSNVQDVVLPVTSGLALGESYRVINVSSGTLQIKASGGATFFQVPGNTSATFTVISTSGTTGVSWNAEFTGFQSATGSGAVVLQNSPTFITPALGVPVSGSLVSCTGLPLTTGVTGILPFTSGGTGVASIGAYTLICGGTSGTNAVQSVPNGTIGQILLANGSSALPSFQDTSTILYQINPFAYSFYGGF